MRIRWISLVPGIILALLGILWSLQGANLVGGSTMSGQVIWIWIGVPVAIVGLGLIFLGVRPRERRA
jgi:hypothetical protein